MNIVIAAGGTGGHLYPAVALAREFQRRDPQVSILFVGAPRGIESKVLAHEGFELRLIVAKPVMGKSVVDAAKGLLSLPMGLWQAFGILREQRADLVIGVGGYTSPTVVVAAFLRGIPRVILEPNAYPGMANKAVGMLAQRVFLAFESAAGFFSASKVRVVGTPIRRAFLEEAQGDDRRSEEANLHLLVFGGSQGAKAINSAMIEALPELTRIGREVSVIHQTGEPDCPRVKAAYQAAGFEAEVVPFLYDMPKVLRAADLVVSRAGAITIAELTVCGKPAILIPLPQAIYDHQARNAQIMEKAGAAVVLPQTELTGTRLADVVNAIGGDRERLREMSERSLAMRRTDSAEVIVRDCYALMGGNHETNRSIGATGDSRG
ncbi:MAG: undecaprenyldiphospho-muramoylpentapeptide beta-N-acetylglucosaminyltransferase [Nitrospiraceae bacterium]